MAAPAVVVIWNSRLSGRYAKPLKIVTFSEDLSDLLYACTPEERKIGKCSCTCPSAFLRDRRPTDDFQEHITIDRSHIASGWP